MKKLACAKCGGTKKMQKGGSSKTKINRDPFAPQVMSVTKGGKTIYEEKRPKGDRGDNSENYRYGNKDKWGRPTTSKWYGFNPKTKKYEYKAGGSTRLEMKIPSGVTGPNMSPRVMKSGGATMGDPIKKAARQAKRAEKNITKQIKKSVATSGKVVKAKRGGIKK